MANGWARDGAVQDQIDASVDDAVKKVRNNLVSGKSLTNCEECDDEISEARRVAIPGVRICIKCQTIAEERNKDDSGINRRGSKDSQLR